MAGRRALFVTRRVDFDRFWLEGVERSQVPATPQTLPPPSTQTPDHGPTLLSDPPVTAQVWWTFAQRDPGTVVDLLIEPSEDALSCVDLLARYVVTDPGQLEASRLANFLNLVVIGLDFETLTIRLLPLTRWRRLLEDALAAGPTGRKDALDRYARGESLQQEAWTLGWFLRLLLIGGRWRPPKEPDKQLASALRWLTRLLRGVDIENVRTADLGRIALNRPVAPTLERSRRTVKADAARQLLDIRCDTIRWAVLDTGIDARHLAFRKALPDGSGFFADPWVNQVDGRDQPFNYTRVAEGWDFTKYRESGALAQRNLRTGSEQNVNLPAQVPLLYAKDFFVPPRSGHGTHVAGILGGVGGICPDIALYDLRVLDEEGHGDEFTVASALRFVLERNRQYLDTEQPGRNRDLWFHGVNLSLSLGADVTSDACGWSLVCRLCDELVRNGVIVVVSAGNTGFEDRTEHQRISTGQDFRTVSITDPANTDRVISVGSTHAQRPLEYGVSYFSARGPTADGRPKPDLLAPGEEISAPFGYKREDDDSTPDTFVRMSGTSQAAAHVSGCAALLIARHRELIGKPLEVKRILKESATDLGRDPNFQGAGLVDALRAVQHV